MILISAGMLATPLGGRRIIEPASTPTRAAHTHRVEASPKETIVRGKKKSARLGKNEGKEGDQMPMEGQHHGKHRPDSAASTAECVGGCAVIDCHGKSKHLFKRLSRPGSGGSVQQAFIRQVMSHSARHSRRGCVVPAG